MSKPNCNSLIERDAYLVNLIKQNLLISSDALMSEIQNLDGVHYFKRDFLFQEGIWRGKKVFSANKIPRKFRKIAVIGHSDIHTIKRDQYRLRLLGYKKVFGINLNPIRNFSLAIPLGLTNRTNESPLHKLFGDTSLLGEAIVREPRNYNFRHEIYANFTIENASAERQEALRMVRTLPLAEIEKPLMTRQGRLNYLTKLRRNAFVLCPAGNGIDTHRLWETLYMGGIPIIKANKSLNKLLIDLPVITVKSWQQVTEKKFMEDQWEKIYSNPMKLEKLSISYWVSKIKANM